MLSQSISVPSIGMAAVRLRLVFGYAVGVTGYSALAVHGFDGFASSRGLRLDADNLNVAAVPSIITAPA